ncbi:DNA-binding transcriptional LysR family regulator [Pseudochelatococcus lubricantis]|uniref:DNA-binding transcriptional LysR family regulator n=1 Tax=Pseudochelatococcus lubricantis TaxID=1538102 RepID=A0ABX0V4T6_9HYPH|nr:LysR substrate-binding domain-containing protein [Pseudochelatococcus lubricantis]NIJ59952.1 DNA-binding transcriptional LysR family regulator [Pseudochelatococcus lubricantis]
MEQTKRRLPSLKALLFLESVIRTGSVTSAADELSVSHSAVSKQLSHLQEWFGAPLFAEKRKGMIPTPETARLAAVLGEAFDRIQDVLDEVRAGTTPPVKLRVIAPATFAMQWLVPRLPEFHVSGGQPVDVMVRPTHTPEKWLEIPFDVAVRRGDVIPSQFSPCHLFTEELTLAVSSRLLAETGGLDRDGLKKISLLEAATRPGELQAWLQNAGLPKSLARPALRFPHFYVALGAMLAGRGALVVPRFLITDALERGEVVEPWPDSRIVGSEYHVLANPASHEAATCQRFINWVRNLTQPVSQGAA